MSTPAVRMRGIDKSFDDVSVLDGVDFEVARGEVHALVGGNGAGKSTLMKILEGVYSLDAGTIEIDGTPVQLHSSVDARESGIAMVFQEFSLIPTLTVAQNVFLTREPKGRVRLVADREAERRTLEIFERMRVDVDPRRPLDELPTAYRQLTEIAKALSQDARVLVMDEPTSSLGRKETAQLFEIIRRLKEEGISIIYISHRMEEVFEVADRISVLRDGHMVLSEAVADLTIQAVIEAIVGRTFERAMQSAEREHVTTEDEVLLEVRGLVSGPKLRGVDMQLRRGEVLGLAGLMGSGRSELARALFGLEPVDAGEIVLRGVPVSVASPQDAMAAHIGLIPEDRHNQGLVLEHSVKDNVLMPLLRRLTRRGFVDDQAGRRVADSFVRTLSVQTPSIDHPIRMLSGGNQQKVVIAKWLATEPHILLMDEPTAGVDVGTKGEIVLLIRAFAQQGNGVIFISSELPELLAVSDRVLVMRYGRIDRELRRAEIAGEEQLHEAVQGVSG
jgi:ribose transport system ATP-binding protein